MLVHAPEYNTDLALYGVDKPFALDRGELVLTELRQEFGDRVKVFRPQPISRADMLRVHTPAYIDSLSNPAVWCDIFEFKGNEYQPERAQRPLNDLIHDIALKCGGTLLACQLALKHGFGVNLGGGYHHAYPDHGSGFCVLHDIAIAIRSLQADPGASSGGTPALRHPKRFMIIDLDFHQGDGSAVVFKSDPDVFTLSVHSDEGWPDEKQQSDLDVPIKSSQSGQYLERTKSAVLAALDQFSPDMVLYVAGSDPYELDVLPGTQFIKLSLETMNKRDEFVIDTFAERGIPIAMVFAGGYGPHVWRVHHFAVREMFVRALSSTR